MQDETTTLVHGATDVDRLVFIVTLTAFDMHLLDDLLEFDICLLIDDDAKTAGFIVFADIGDCMIEKTIVQRWHGDKEMAGQVITGGFIIGLTVLCHGVIRAVLSGTKSAAVHKFPAARDMYDIGLCTKFLWEGRIGCRQLDDTFGSIIEDLVA